MFDSHVKAGDALIVRCIHRQSNLQFLVEPLKVFGLILKFLCNFHWTFGLNKLLGLHYLW